MKSIVIVCVVAGWVSTVSAGGVLEKAPFAATPQELLALAATAPAGDWPVVKLREEHQLDFDARGRAVRRWRMIFVVRSQAGVDDWGTLSTTWSPYYQDKPTVRLRVIEPGGKVTEVDQALITDAPTVSSSPSVYSDRRRMQVPLPRLQVGSVVEEEIVTVDRAPLLEAGVVDTYGISDDVPVTSTRIVLSAPAATKAKVVLRGPGTPVPMKRTVAGGRETWTIELDRQRESGDGEGYAPGDVVQFPYVGIATGASWQAIARGYRALVEARIAQGPVELPRTIAKVATLDTVRQIVAWVHKEVRYTGIELADAAITPWTPAETLKRGFGDCKDKATLTVALLRAAGIRADLALLSTGPGVDVDPGLPGMGTFDHAIVRAQVGGRDVWIDATEDLYPVGALPPRDQGRLALVVAEDAKALTRTPVPSSQDTFVREVRTYELAELGRAKILEVSREGGVFEAQSRGWIRDTQAAEVRKSLEKYASGEYDAKLESFSSTAPEDLSTPFELTVRASAAAIAYSGREQIEVTVRPRDLYEKLPSALTKVDDAAPPRKHPFEHYIPHRYEIEHRFQVPDGFTLPAAAARQVHTLGAVTITESERVDGRTFVISYVLDTGKRRLTPAEVVATAKALRTYGETSRRVVFEQTAIALGARGRWVEALAAIDELIRSHPKEALHHTQRAQILLFAGAGAAARRSARRAVELGPKDADAHTVLGWVLRHDTLGREFGFDHDRAGALAAYRKARALDPEHLGALRDHARTLEVDARGHRFGDGADIAGAIEAWRAAYARSEEDEDALSLARALLRTDRAAEAERVLRALSASEQRDGLWIAAIAIGQSADAAERAASTLRSGKARDTLLGTAGSVALLLGSYDTARALAKKAGTAQGADLASRIVQQVKRSATVPRPTADPREAVRRALFDVMIGADDAFWDARTAAAFHEASPDTRARALDRRYLWDMVSSVATLTVEGRKTGPWRVNLAWLGVQGAMFVALDRGVAKVFAGTEETPGLVLHAQRLLAAGDKAGAAQCLDWFADTLGDKNPLAIAWRKGAVTADFIVALLLADPKRVSALSSCPAELRETCDGSAASALFGSRRWAELVAHGAAMTTRGDAARALAFQVAGLSGLGKHGEAEKLIAEVASKDPSSLDVLRARHWAASIRNDRAEEVRALAAIASHPKGTAVDRNNYAWLLLAADGDAKIALEHAHTAVQLATHSKDEMSSKLNTLAVAAVAAGDLATGLREGVSSMERAGRRTPASQDWYLFGRLYEALGLTDDAAAAYKRTVRTVDAPESSYALAQERLAKLAKRR